MRIALVRCTWMVAALAGPVFGQAPGGPQGRDVSARARAIGTDRIQDEPARVIVTDPGRAPLKFPGFVLDVEKGHDDVRNEKVGRLLRTLMGRIGPRQGP